VLAAERPTVIRARRWPSGMRNDIARFWSLFQQRAANLAAAESADCVQYDELLAALHEIDPGLYLEFSIGAEECELIVTADGDQARFPIAHEVVAAAPAVDGWTFRCLKPKVGLPKVVQWENLTLSTATIVFDPLEREGSDDLGLRIFVPGIESRQIDDAHNAVLRAMDHILGEKRFAESVQHTEVQPLPPGADTKDLIPLADLDSFIEWRARRKHDAG